MTSSGVVVGFIPLLDCAPLVAAVEKGFADEEGIDLTLVRETSWANIRDRVVVGHFDAAHMLGPMTVASTLGIGHLRVPMVAPLSLGLGGNAITVSQPLWQQMQKAGAAAGANPLLQGQALHDVVMERQRGNEAQLTFAMVYPFSCHNYELRYWLSAVGIDPDHDVRLVVLPPPLLVDALREGHIDGFCAGEPWNSLAVSVGVGSIIATTTAIWRLSPEKALGCRREWAERFPERIAALIRALYRSSEWCEQPDNREELARLLSESKYVGAPAHILQGGLSGNLTLVPGSEPQSIENFYLPSRHFATFPWISHALWFYSQMVRWKQIEFSSADLEAVHATYRPDLYRAALAPLNVPMPDHDSKAEGLHPSDGFFDGRVFDAARLREYLAEE
ncbi:CmpA/NrtA family ABC transporter substrate-binding protein [Povalibacter sp.]|uniref:CmpA/NrtA family ABC transporter substrate-binding protein n=1 Tax=Povalibacter sp. TaxID=1962978 RepID=UPI002F3F3A36